MAKKQKNAKGKKKDRKKQGRAVRANALLGTFAGGVVGKVLERLVVNEIEGLLRPLRHPKSGDKAHDDEDGGGGGGGARHDVAGRLLTVLADGGPRDIPQLLTETNLGLSKLLHALHALRDFRLVNFVGGPGEETVEVTRSGSHAVTALRKNDIQAQAAKLLAS
jgi:hypothetical protein